MFYESSSSLYPKHTQAFEDAVSVLEQDIATLNTADDKNALLKDTWMLSYDGIHQLLPSAQGNTDTFKEDLGKAVRIELNNRFGEGEFGKHLSSSFT